MPDQPQTEDEVRSLVREIVGGVLDTPAEPAAAPEPLSEPAPSAPSSTKIAIGADHGGLPLKEKIAFELRQSGHEVHDVQEHLVVSILVRLASFLVSHDVNIVFPFVLVYARIVKFVL